MVGEQGGELYTPSKTEIKAIKKGDAAVTETVFEKIKAKHKEVLAGSGITGHYLENESNNRANEQMKPWLPND